MAISLYLFCWVAIYSYGFVVQSKKDKHAYSGGYPFSISGDIRSVPS